MRHWLRGGRAEVGDQIADLVAFGLDHEAATAFVDPVQAPAIEFGLWPQNGRALEVFMRHWPRWLINPMTGARRAMDHAQLAATLGMMGVPVAEQADLLTSLAHCERAVLEDDALLAALNGGG